MCLFMKENLHVKMFFHNTSKQRSISGCFSVSCFFCFMKTYEMYDYLHISDELLPLLLIMFPSLSIKDPADSFGGGTEHQFHQVNGC